jgi:hypothetical protein
LKNGKKIWVLGGLIVAAFLLTMPASAAAKVYVEGYLGGVLPGPANTDVTTSGSRNILVVPNIIACSKDNHLGGSIDPAVIGGLKAGTWFVPQGFLGFNYPDWMKYLGFYLDLSFNRLEFPHQGGRTLANCLGN